MEISKFKDLLFQKALNRGFEACEIFYSNSDSLRISVYKGKIEKFQNKSSGGFGFRGLHNGKMGYFFSELIDEDIIDTVISNAIENAKILTSPQKEFIFEGSKSYEKVRVYSDKINEIITEEKIEMALLMETTAKNYSDKIKAVNTSMINTGESLTYIANTKGMELNEKSNYYLAYVEVMAESNGEVKEKGEIYLGIPDNFNAKLLAENACKKAISALNGSSLKSGKYKTVIKNETFADFMECFVGNFYAENVQKGFSLLKNKVGEKIASEIITIKDNPLMDYGYMTTAFDSEGVASYNKEVIKDGVLKTYLYNLKSAKKDNTTSTGNGFKASFKGAVSTSHTNFYIENGNCSFDELIADVENGIYITDVTGLHAGANSISGDFSLAAEGFKIENGKITSAVEQITIAGNFYSILKSVLKISDDLKFNTSGVGSPSVLVDIIDIAGL
ncbi:MAG: TldD/PmbA family protein [Lachnospirales bacterium]